MNRLFWLINIILLTLAVFITDSIMGYRPDQAAVAASKKIGGEVKAASGKRVAEQEVAVAPADTTPIWKQSLFRPDRSEDESAEDGSTAEEEKSSDLDLIAICIIGKGKVAVILTPQAATQPQPRAFMPGGGMMPNTPANQKKPERIKHVFSVGQTIGNTGYTIKEINNNDVLIARGGVEKTLEISFGDESSKKRMDDAAGESRRREETNRALAAGNQAAVSKTNQPPPPPPPPTPTMPGMSGGTTSQPPAMTEETRKRIEEIKKRRAEILQRMQEQHGSR